MAPRRIHYQYRRPGKATELYQQWLVLDRPDAKVLLQERYGATAPLRIGGGVVLEPGAPIVWYVFPDQWYDIGRFHLANDTLTGWYTNLTTPVEMNGDRWAARDLFLDLWMPAAGGAAWLDEEELEQARRAGHIDRGTHVRVMNQRAMIDLRVQMGAWPPAIARDLDLLQARQLLT